MIQAFLTSFKLKNTYRVNTIIYSLKQLPLIGKKISSGLYENSGLKILGNMISVIIEIGSVFIPKLLYVAFMISAMVSVYKGNSANIFIHLFVFATFAGALFNTYMFNPSKDKYYAMIIMNMDAKMYTLSNYYYTLLKVLIGLLPFTIIFGLLAKLNIFICLLLPIFTVIVKIIVSSYLLYRFGKTGKASNENLPTPLVWIGGTILLTMGYGLPAIKIVINPSIFLIIFLITIVVGVYSFIKINSFNKYKKMYKQILTDKNVYAVKNQNSSQMLKETSIKQIELDKSFTSNKSGFRFFHELFVKRHSKILTKAVKKQTLAILAIFIFIIVGIYLYPELSLQINKMLLVYLPYFVFIMYLLNRGTTVTQAMFMNCDHSMLTFRIYRTPKIILGIFKERLKTLITINLLPALVIAIGLPLLLYLTGGTNNQFNYIILFVSIIAMSIFFSVHYLVMYYLLQPYNVNTEMKSSTYKVVQTITYMVCYFMIKTKMPTFYFGLAMTIFSILYSIISLVIVYFMAPKTFKLRL